jgi:hypothetical protein
MTKRRVAWIAAAILGVVGIAGALWSTITGGRIELTAAQLQERVNRALPREFKGVTVDSATVAIADGRIELRVEVHATALGQSFAATASARGLPVYEAERGELFFEADNIAVSRIRPTGGNLAERVDRSRLGQRLEEAAGKLVAAGIKAYLAARPVYRFKDDVKGIVLKAAVTNVAIESDRLVITVSLISLTRTVALFLGLLLLALILLVQLRLHPGWGIGLLADASDASPIGLMLMVVFLGVLVLALVVLARLF